VTKTQAKIHDIARDANWLAHRYDPEHDAIHLIHVPRTAHRAATFLTDEYLKLDREPLILRRADLVAAAPSPAPVHFIFHSAFCLSTLLARAFDIPGRAIGLKEPVLLNDLSGWRQRGADPRLLSQVLNESLRLLARPFEQGESVIIKPSNVVNGLAPAMLGLRPDARAILLHAPLVTYLRSIAKKGMWGRLWVRDLLVKLLRDDLIDLGFEGDDYLGLTDLQVAAVGWIAQQAHFAQLVTQFGAERVKTLDSETILARPAETISALATLFDVALDATEVRAVIEGPAFRTHSKSGADFSGEARQAEYDVAAEVHGDEIEKVALWARAVAANAGVEMGSNNPLI
jgi:hypothetical protein